MAKISKSVLIRENVYKLIDQERSKFKQAVTEDDGATFKSSKNSISKGCLACKAGEWICIYIGMECQLACDWCVQPHEFHKPDKAKFIRPQAAGGNLSSSPLTLAGIDRTISQNPQISGISFSGGEPLFYKDKIREWSYYFRQKYPYIYLWFYTNGVLLDEETCKSLADAGINEIRLDLAATEYSKKIINKIKYARNYFEKICVEVPVTEWNSDKLIEVLPYLEQLGVDYLNLHDLVLFKENYQILNQKYGIKAEQIYIDPRWQISRYLSSTFEVYRVMSFIEENKINISTNDCNLRNMVNQYIGFYLQGIRSSDSLFSGLLQKPQLGMEIFNLYQNQEIDKSIFDDFKSFRDLCKKIGYFP